MKYIVFTLILKFISLIQFQTVQCQINCADAPTPAAKIVCEQLHRWDKNARVYFN